MGKEKEVSVVRSAESFPQRFEREFERMFDDFFRRRWPRALSFDWPQAPALARENGVPRMDVVDGADAVTVRAELPGIAAKDVEVSVSDNTITIKGSCSHEETRQDGDYWQREIHEGESARTLSLPSYVDADRASAKLKDGLLEVTLPKTEQAKRQRIAVSG
ncbi:MAG: Hsp20/alpha crystallin family protein [Pseudomonadales bacterium]|jgi:HSP20 family protein